MIKKRFQTVNNPVYSGKKIPSLYTGETRWIITKMEPLFQ